MREVCGHREFHGRRCDREPGHEPPHGHVGYEWGDDDRWIDTAQVVRDSLSTAGFFRFDTATGIFRRSPATEKLLEVVRKCVEQSDPYEIGGLPEALAAVDAEAKAAVT